MHRVAAAFNVQAVCLAAYDPIAGQLDILHRAGARHRWDAGLLVRAAQEKHTVNAAGTLAVPVFYEDGLFGDGRQAQVGSGRRIWGVLAIARPASDGAPATFTSVERQTLRAVAARIAAELERRHLYLLDDVLDDLLRKTKPIDVYTHTLREVRRFIRYDHSASVMTMQRGMAQITIRAEKAVTVRGTKETLLDSARRGRVVMLTEGQMQRLGELEEAFVLTRDDNGWRSNRVMSEADASSLWRVLGLDDGAGKGSVLCYPLVFGDQMLGILRLAAKRPGAFDPIRQYGRLLERFARLLSVTLYRSELYYQSDRQLQAIKQIGRAITEPIPVEQICEQVLQLALRVLHVEVGVVGLLTDDGSLQLVAHRGCTLAEVPALAEGEGISGMAVRMGRSWAVPDVSREPSYVVFNARVRSELVAPITYNREVIGFLDVESYEVGRFREENEEVITFLEALANQAAIAIKTAQLHFEAVKRLGASMSIDPALSSAGLQDLLIDELRDKIEQLGAANERLSLANRAKSEFLARMSHDLRGPLNVIVGLANLLTDPSVAPGLTLEKQHESLEIIRSSGEVLGSLIGNILDLSALEAGKVELNLAPVDAAATFSYLRAMAATLAEESRRELDITVESERAITRINVDEQKFLRIMINLISNAIKFTPSGGWVEVTAMVDQTIPDGLHLVVRDTGVGIPPEHHENIFEPFRRIEGGPSGGPRGTGLGLAVVRQLVELHGGRVWVESEPDEGSRFHVLLPGAVLPTVEAPAGPAGRHPARASKASKEQAAVTAPAPSSPEPDPHSRGLVLVVEDTEDHMNLMRLAVTSRGYTMHGVTTGEDAIAWLADNRPDVILLDMQLPGIDGFSVAAHIRGQVETHAIPLIAVTADALSVNEERALASGCDAYLTKPIDLGGLMATIDSVAR
ncbi:MAG: GAF domain-containing protein [Chloroflexi bacterium]|nr:GAF domain-containing protein [Chloroflexota bacterium]